MPSELYSRDWVARVVAALETVLENYALIRGDDSAESQATSLAFHEHVRGFFAGSVLAQFYRAPESVNVHNLRDLLYLVRQIQKHGMQEGAKVYVSVNVNDNKDPRLGEIPPGLQWVRRQAACLQIEFEPKTFLEAYAAGASQNK